MWESITIPPPSPPLNQNHPKPHSHMPDTLSLLDKPEFVDTKLLQLYGKFGCLDYPDLLFDKMTLRNLFSWTAMLSFGLGIGEIGRRLNGNLIKYLFVSNIYVGNALIDTYGKCGSLDDVKKVLETMPKKHCVMECCCYRLCSQWEGLLGGFAQNGYDEKAIEMFRMVGEGIEPNAQTLASVLPACARLAKLSLGKEFHGFITSHRFMSNPIVVNGFIDVYRRCGDTTRHVENDLHDKAIQLFSEMQATNMRPDIYTIGIIRPACSRSATIEWGKQVHAQSIRCGYDADVYIGAALVDMFAKYGSIQHAFLAYNRISDQNLVSHNAMLTAYAMHGHGEDGIALIRRMLENGFRPDRLTFLSPLSSCVHVGSVEMGQELFDLMQQYNVKPTIKALYLRD
ncbi:hypothetical protein CRYUN_Cryun12cG0077300 [Craigia yunnanensis]